MRHTLRRKHRRRIQTYCTDICQPQCCVFWCISWNSLVYRVICTILSKSLCWRSCTGQTEYLYGCVSPPVSILALFYSLFGIFPHSVLRPIRQGNREEGEVHGDALGHAAQRWDLLRGFQGEWRDVDCVPPDKSVL